MFLQFGAQGRQVQRLDQPRLHADSGAAFAFLAKGVGGDADDRQRFILLAQRFGQLVAVHEWHIHIGQHQVVTPGQPLRQGLFAIRRHHHRATQRFELFLDHRRVDHIVFGHQYAQVQLTGFCRARGWAVRVGIVVCQDNCVGNRAHIVGIDGPGRT